MKASPWFVGIIEYLSERLEMDPAEVGMAMVLGIELAVQHPEYAAAMRQESLSFSKIPTERIVGYIVRDNPIEAMT